MAKRGPKPFTPGCRRLMPVSVIAHQLGVSARTVEYDLQRAISKMQIATVAYLQHHQIILQEVR